MSFIYDALTKAQAKRDDRYRPFDGILPEKPTVKKSGIKHSTAILAAILVVAVLCGSLFAVWPEKRNEQPVQASAPPQPMASAKPVDPKAGADHLYANALNRQRLGDNAAAEALYRQVLAVQPHHPYALNNLGVIRMTQKKDDEAVFLFREAIRLRSGYAHPYYNLACVYARENRLEESLHHLRQAGALEPEMLKWAAKDKDLRNLGRHVEFKTLAGKGED